MVSLGSASDNEIHHQEGTYGTYSVEQPNVKSMLLPFLDIFTKHSYHMYII